VQHERGAIVAAVDLAAGHQCPVSQVPTIKERMKSAVRLGAGSTT